MIFSNKKMFSPYEVCDGSNLVFNQLISKKIGKNIIKKKKKEVYDYMLEHFSTKNFDNLTKCDLDKLFNVIDEVYFNNLIKKDFITKNISFENSVSDKLTRTGGYFASEKYFMQIKISRKIILSIFENDEKSLNVCGTDCLNRLECLIAMYEH